MDSQGQLNYEELLPFVRKPSQYIGEEVNSIKKDLKKIQATISLVFPDKYEIGMSHLGLKILYHIVNKREEFAAERVFAPDLDYEELLREKCMPLASLENKLPLNKFDIIGFTIPYEMSYTNILNILDLGHIPLLRKDRGEDHPLIIGGGPCAYNPEPLADFFDCFIVGDGEEVIVEILELFAESKKKKETKNQMLRRLTEIKGIYIPSMFNIKYFENGSIKQIEPENKRYAKIEKRILLDLDKADYPVAPVVPYAKLVHDRISIEIDRGCTQACRFCQAGFTYRPVRERTVEKILELTANSIEKTGYGEISLLSLSSGDYSRIDKLLSEFIRSFSSSNVFLSLPSLQPGTIKKDMVDCMRLTGKGGITIAVESGSQRLRNVLNKKITEEEVLTATENFAQAGWETIKLYFMVGLPTETDNDLEEIYLICKKVFSKAKQKNPRFKKLNIGISFFVPKPHTPFQWISQANFVYVEKKLKFLRSKFKSRSKYKIKWQNPKLSFLEGVFARGDRRLGKVLLHAFQLGCKFDGWSERFNFESWMAAFEKAQIDPAFYTQNRIDKDEIFPWDLIDIGVKKEHLFKEHLQSKKEIKEEDCRQGKCIVCGLENICTDINPVREVSADRSVESTLPSSIALTPILPETFSNGLKKIEKRKPVVTQYDQILTEMDAIKQEDAIFKYRIQFTKTFLARFLSHLEISSLLVRALRRAKIPVDYSKGFHPRPRISFAFALPVGMESKEELFDIFLTAEMRPDSIRSKLNNVMPMRMGIHSIMEIPLNSKPLSVINNKIHFKIYINGIKEIQPLDLPLHEKRLAEFLSRDKINLFPEKDGEMEEIFFNSWFDSLKIQSMSKKGLILELVAKVNDGRLVSPRKILSTLYPELKNDKGNYRMVKEAAYYVV
tara:strand:- start:4462 stop:7149 length:2688 start_codon:yes stop_codon:yes gene_type:complete